MKRTTNREIWDLLRIEDPEGNPQFGIRLNGKAKRVDFFIKDYLNQIQTARFKRSKEARKASDKLVQLYLFLLCLN